MDVNVEDVFQILAEKIKRRIDQKVTYISVAIAQSNSQPQLSTVRSAWLAGWTETTLYAIASNTSMFIYWPSKVLAVYVFIIFLFESQCVIHKLILTNLTKS